MLMSALGLVIGCGTTPTPNAISYSECRASESDRTMSAYLTPNGAAATCLPTEAVIYMTCVRDLAIVDASWSHEVGGELNLAMSGSPVAPDIHGKIVNEISSKYAAEGELAKARAEALKYCKDLSDRAKSGTTPSAAK
jgi:hypothetical protein